MWPFAARLAQQSSHLMRRLHYPESVVKWHTPNLMRLICGVFITMGILAVGVGLLDPSTQR